MSGGGLRFLSPLEDPCTVLDYVDVAALPGRTEVVFYEELLDAELLPGLYVFTGLNRLGPATARAFAALHAELAQASGIEPLNHPLRTLRRYQLLRTLHSAGLNDFNAYGATEDFSRIRLPAFVRPREVDGGIPELAHSTAELEKAVGAYLMDGWRLEELLVVEFEDVADEGGGFVKYSAFIVGDRILPVSVDRGRRWVVRRHSTESGPELAETAYRYVVDNPHETQLRDIFRIAHTQFGRIDYSLKDGRVLTWEINTLPMLRQPGGHPTAPGPGSDRTLDDMRRTLIRTAWADAWRDLADRLPAGGRTTRPTFDRASLAVVRSELDARRGLYGAVRREVRFRKLRRLLRPFKPVLKPLADRVLLGRLARREERAQRG